MEIAREVSESSWMDFVYECPGFNLFQSPAFYHVLERTRGYRPHVLTSSKDGTIQAVLVSVLVSYLHIKFNRFVTSALILGGPLGEPAFFPALLEAHDSIASRGAVLSQIRNVHPPESRETITNSGYVWTDQLDYVIDLRKDEEDLLRAMSKSRRKNLSIADESDLHAVQLSARDKDEIYAVLRQTYSRAGIPLADRSLFDSALDALPRSGDLWAVGARHVNDLCALRLVLRWKDWLFDWYAGSTDVGRRLHADEWLLWRILRDGIKEGCHTFIFGGAGEPDKPYGPREFKRRFGGEMVNPGRFEKVYHPVMLRGAEFGYRVWRKLH